MVRASESGHAECVVDLIKAGASLEAVNKASNTFDVVSVYASVYNLYSCLCVDLVWFYSFDGR